VKTVLCNADVVEIIEYEGDRRKAFQRHQQWLKVAKTRSARHKLTKYLRETGAALGEELTGDLVKEFVLDEGEHASELVESSSSGEDSDGPPPGVSQVNGHLIRKLDERIDEEERRILAERIEEEEARVSRDQAGVSSNQARVSSKQSAESSNGRPKGRVNGFPQPGGLSPLEREAEMEAGLVFRGYQLRQLTQWHEEGETSVMWLDVRCSDRKGEAGVIVSSRASQLAFWSTNAFILL
jgi:GTP pyrophosphokinase